MQNMTDLGGRLWAKFTGHKFRKGHWLPNADPFSRTKFSITKLRRIQDEFRKIKLSFFSPERCTGCKSCEMICSLQQTGKECSRTASCINVNTHPYLYSSVVSVSMDCNCADGKEMCADICAQDALAFLAQKDAPALMKNREWWPGAVVSSSRKA